jgi:hypothetical protein
MDGDIMKFDARYLWLLVVPAVILGLINLDLLIEYVSVLSIVLLIAGFTHIIRKILMPYVDMGKLIDDGADKGLVFLGMAIMISAFALVLAALIHVGH